MKPCKGCPFIVSNYNYLKTLLCTLLILLSGCTEQKKSTIPRIYPQQFSPEGLEPYVNQAVEVRGFWYPLEDTGGILTTYPNIRSCCIKERVKNADVLLIKEPLFPRPKTGYAITIRGTLKQTSDNDHRLLYFLDGVSYGEK